MSLSHLQSAAQSFGGVVSHQSACYHYFASPAEPYKSVLADYYTAKVIIHQPKLKAKYVQAVVNVALLQLTYPANTQWSARERAAAAGIAKSTWADQKLCLLTDRIINHIRLTADVVQGVIARQIDGKGSPMARTMTEIEF